MKFSWKVCLPPVRDVCQSGEQREEPRLGIGQGFHHPFRNASQHRWVERRKVSALFFLEMFILDPSLIHLRKCDQFHGRWVYNAPRVYFDTHDGEGTFVGCKEPRGSR
jgi:hypothetical protein